MHKIYIFGGKGNGTVVLSTLLDINQKSQEYEILGFINNKYKSTTDIDGFKCHGDITDFPLLHTNSSVCFINAISSVSNMGLIKKLYATDNSHLRSYMCSVIHPSAHLSYNVRVGKGVYIGPGVYIGQNTIIDDGAFIHAQTYIARDTHLEEFSYFSPQSYVGAECHVGPYSYVGIGAKIMERLHIGENSVIGMGSIIVNDVEQGSTYFGIKATRKK